MKKGIALIGFASDLGGTLRGSKDGPQALRALKLAEVIRGLGYAVEDFGDVREGLDCKAEFSEEEKQILNLKEVHSLNAALYQQTEKAIERELFPLVLGGDHSLSIGSVAGIASAYSKRSSKIGLIWIDTHPDINTPQTSPSKCAFGMSTAILLGRVKGALGGTPSVEEENLVFIGLRDVDSGEKEFLRQSDVHCFSVKDIDIHGMQHVAHQAIQLASKNTDGFVVSFDLDVCDPRLVPGTGTPYRGGLTFRESHLLMECLYESKKMLGLELVELNPALDKGNATAELALSLIESALGDSIL